MNKKIKFNWKQKSNKLYWLAGLAMLCCVSGVFAYWTQELTAHNEFKTAKYDTRLEEKFISPDDWLPGVQINKDVWVENKGSIPVFAKLVINQEWIRQQNVTDLDGNVIAPAAGEAFPLIFDTGDSNEYAAQISWGKQVVLLGSGRADTVHLTLPVVDSIQDAAGKWLLVDEQPNQNGNYILYYIGIIDENGSSPLVVDAVTMNPKIQAAILGKVTNYDATAGKWITTAKRNDSYDYECAKYTMLVTATTVQATADAVQTVFGTAEDNKEVVSYLTSYAVKPTEL